MSHLTRRDDIPNSGYLLQEAATKDAARCNGLKASDCGCEHKSVPTKTASHLPGKVLYGSQKGTAATFAKQIARQAASLGVELQAVGLKDYEVEQLWKEHLVIFVLSTYEHGSPPTSARSVDAATQRQGNVL